MYFYGNFQALLEQDLIEVPPKLYLSTDKYSQKLIINKNFLFAWKDLHDFAFFFILEKEIPIL